MLLKLNKIMSSFDLLPFPRLEADRLVPNLVRLLPRFGFVLPILVVVLSCIKVISPIISFPVYLYITSQAKGIEIFFLTIIFDWLLSRLLVFDKPTPKEDRLPLHFGFHEPTFVALGEFLI